MMINWRQQLFAPVSAINLALFRIVFGIIMCWEMLYMIRIGFVDNFIYGPQLLFPYEGLEFIQPLPAMELKLLLMVMLVCSLLVTIGYWFKPAVALLTIGFTYLFLLDQSIYNNHLYLICMLGGLLFFSGSDGLLSPHKAKRQPLVPQWQMLIFQFMVLLVYFYGGLAKINPDWFAGEPMRMLLPMVGAKTGLEVFNTSAALAFFTWGGLLFDLTIPFFLIWKRTRYWAMIPALFFNLTNGLLLFDDINIFPFFMIGSLVLFIEPHRLPAWLRNTWIESAKKISRFAYSQQVVVVLSVFVALQLLLPFRHVLYPQRTDWTGYAQRFSWRMKIQHREIEQLEFWAYDRVTPDSLMFDPKLFMTFDQYHNLARHPLYVLEFRDFIIDFLEERQVFDPIVKVKFRVAFNGRPAQYVIDPQLDLTTVTHRSFTVPTWILPLEEATVAAP